ncbi:DNA polymerase III subunit alpha [Candidatus Dojkabacteria bacterium]|nr:DNA polymerase III subunit alpha [Candidatus Dojkabacteria bacterium]
MFTHLHVHSEFSLLDGLSSLNSIVKRVAEAGMKSVALTDHGVLFGVHKFYMAAKAAGIKPIIGVEAYVAQRTRFDKVAKLDNDPYHLILLAKDSVGYKNLVKLISLANIEGFYYKPRIDRELIEIYKEGLIATSGCLAGEIPQLILNKQYAKAKEVALWYQGVFGMGNYYLELQANRMLDQKKVNSKLIELSRDTGIPLVATTDAHYPTADNAFAQDVLLAINTKKKISDTNRLTMADTPDFYLWKEDEMREYFKDIPEALENTVRVADMCNVDLDPHDWVLPNAYVPDEYKGDADKYLHDIVWARAPKKLGREMEESEEARLKYEYDIISQKGFSKYMLMVSEFTDWMNERNLPFTTRGSAAGSLVSFALGIVNANPLDFNLAFERFLNPLRPKAPDIDLDIPSNRRDDLIKYAIKKHGSEKVAHIITFGRMQARGSIRDAGRVLDLPLDYVDRIAKLIPPSGQGLAKVTIQKALDSVSELAQLIDTDPDARRLIDVAKQIEGTARNTGIHACGILVTPGPITDYVPVVFDKDLGRMVTQYEMDSLEELKLIKVDFLGLTNLETIIESVKLTKQTYNKDINLEELDFKDKKVYETINKLDTLGIFQLESDVMKQTIKTIRPENIFDVAAVNALVRPGPNQYQQEYADRKSGKKEIKYLDPRMEDFLKLSYGVLVYQEDIIRAVIHLAGMDWGEADSVRKATGKKKPDILFAMKDDLLKRLVDNGMDKKTANELFELFIPFTNYAFNQAHAAAYAIIIYYTAWLKTYYPVAFMAALLKTEIADKEKVAKILDECFRKGIKILPPSINESNVDYKIEGEDAIRIGLGTIKGISKKTLRLITKKRDQEQTVFESLDHLLFESNLLTVPIKTFELLIMAGALDEFGDRQGHLEILDALYKKFKSDQERKSIGQNGLFGGSKDTKKIIPAKTLLPSSVETTPAQKIAWEKELIGIFVSDHPQKRTTGLRVKCGITDVSNLSVGKVGRPVTIMGSITNVKRISTKKGDPMAFVKLEDLSGSIEVVVFPNVYKKYKEILSEDKMVAIKGKINERNDELSILADAFKEISEEMISKYENSCPLEDNSDGVATSEASNNTSFSPNDIKPKNGSSKDSSRDSISEKLVKIFLPKDAPKTELLKLKDLISAHPGEAKLVLELDDGNGGKKIPVKQGVAVGDWFNSYRVEIIG